MRQAFLGMLSIALLAGPASAKPMTAVVPLLDVTLPGNQRTGFGGQIGPGKLRLVSDGLSLTIEITTAADMNDPLVFYFDTVAGSGFPSTTSLLDSQDTGRRCVAGQTTNAELPRSDVLFPQSPPAPFAADFGVFFRPQDGGYLYGLVDSAPLNFLTAVAPSGGTPQTRFYVLNVPLPLLGLASGQSFSLVATMESLQGFRSDEAVGEVSTTGNPGFGSIQFLAAPRVTIGCPAGSIASQQGGCVPCDPSCATCSAEGPNACLTCSASGQDPHPQFKTCCGSGQYGSPTGCLPCDASCGSCSGAGPNACLTCATPGQSPAAPFNTCCAAGTTGTANGCASCDASCATCSGQGPTACLTCSTSGQDPHPQFNTCCASGAYGTPEGCLPCDASCATCSGAGPNACLTCANPGQTPAIPLNTCCAAGTYGTPNGCVPCDASCATCSGAGPNACLTCTNPGQSPAAPFNTCCAAGTTGTANGCVPCHASCATCSGEGPNACLTCTNPEQTPAVPFSTCCAPGTYPTENGCVPCDASCATCSGAGPNACATCPSGATLSDAGTCDSEPPAVCGDGTLGGNEECDHGPLNGEPNVCCTVDCKRAPTTQVCRQAKGSCDVAELCDASGSCPENGFAADQAPCTEGLCLTPGSCGGGVCQGQAPITCSTSNSGPCQLPPQCNPSTGQCESAQAPDGAPCNDFAGCTANDTCQNGQCIGTAASVCVAGATCVEFPIAEEGYVCQCGSGQTPKAVFGPPTLLTSTAKGARSVAAGAFSSSGRRDLVVASNLDGRITLFRSNASGFDGGTPIWSGGMGPSGVFVADLDGDGNQDVLASLYSGNRVVWFKNLGGGEFNPTPNVIATSAGGPQPVVAGDVNGDGIVDVVFGSLLTNRVSWVAGLGNGSFDATATTIVAGRLQPRSLALMEINGAQGLEVLATFSGSGVVAWYENVGRGASSWIEHKLATSHVGAHSATFGDLNLDGIQDIAWAAFGTNTVAYHLGLGQAEFGAKQTLTTTAKRAMAVIAPDLDGDGFKDLVVATSGDNRLVWSRNLGFQSFGFAAPLLLTEKALGAISVVAADFDGNGTRDLALASSGDGSVRVFFNSGTPCLLGFPGSDTK